MAGRSLQQLNPLNLTVAEIGAGSGRLIECIYYLKEGKGDFLATDIATDQLTQLGELGIQVVMADMRQNILPTGDVDLAVSWRVIHHLDEQGRKEAVEELRRAVGPEGQLILAARSNKDWGYGLGEETEPGSFVVLHQGHLPQGMEFFPNIERHPWHFFEPGELENLLENGGFELNQVGLLQEPAGIPELYQGMNSYLVVRATRSTFHPQLWPGMGGETK